MTHSATDLCIQDANGTYRPAPNDEIFAAARARLNRQFRRGQTIQSPDETKNYLVGQLAHEPDEIFAVLYLDCRHRILEFSRHFTGTQTISFAESGLL